MNKKRPGQVGRRDRSNQRRKTWFYINLALAAALIVAGLGMLLWMGKQSATSQAATLSPVFSQQKGQIAPDFTLSSLQGKPVSLTDYSGQVILVNMWATWCPPCKAEMPDINDFYEAHRQEGFTVLAVNSQEDTQTVNAFIEQSGFSFPVLLDSRAKVMERYQVRGLPTSFVIGRDGTIRHVQTGAISAQQLETIITPLLSES